MIHLRLANGLGLPVTSRSWTYGLAGECLVCDVAFEALGTYLLPGSRPLLPSTEPFPLPLGTSETGCRSVLGWIGGETRKVVCHGGAAGFGIHVSGIGRFAVSVPNGHIRCVSLETGCNRARLEEVLLGPPLVLSLACRDIWCLHASAVNLRGGAVLFLGASGQGKSTLAEYCARRPGKERIADDVLPCALVNGVPCAKPHFPQLKLVSSAQYAIDADGCLSINALVFLAPVQNARVAEIVAVPPIEAVKQLAEQTVAVSLFDPALHRRHLRFLASLLESIPVFGLRYSHDYDQLPAVCDAVAKQLPILNQAGGNNAGFENAAQLKS